MDFSKLFGLQGPAAENRGALFSKLERILAGLPENDQKYLTGLCGLLGSVAYSDQYFSDHELERIKKILNQQSGLNAAQVELAATILRELTEDLGGIEDYRYYRLLNQLLDKEERIKLLACLFSVAAADEEISSSEEHRIGIIARDLRLSRQDYLTARSNYLDYLSVLRD